MLDLRASFVTLGRLDAGSSPSVIRIVLMPAYVTRRPLISNKRSACRGDAIREHISRLQDCGLKSI